MEYKDYYKILGVPKSAQTADIKKAYRKLARKYHPDVSKEKDAESRFKELGEAYEVLKDSEKRASYDQLGPNWKSGQDFRPPPGWQGGFRTQTGGFGEQAGFSDFFESLFGGGGMGGFQSRTRRAPPRGQDLNSSISIDLKDAYKGITKILQLRVPTINQYRQVETKLKKIKVKINAGVTQDQQMRLKGQGAPSQMGGQNGDLYLKINIAKHPYYYVEGHDLYLNLPITPWEAALGGKIKVPTFDGHIELKIPPDSQTGKKLRLKGKGMPGQHHGDLYIILQIKTPKADTQKAKELYEKMSAEIDFNPRTEMDI